MALAAGFFYYNTLNIKIVLTNDNMMAIIQNIIF